MKLNKKVIIALFISLLMFGIFNFTLRSVRANGIIPPAYSNKLNLDGVYNYKVLGFGAEASWKNLSGGIEANWASVVDDMILVNISGFYNRDSDDIIGDIFSDTNMPWFNIEIYKNAILNFSMYNVSNSEISRNLGLGFSGFQSGFIIPYNQTEWIKANATLEAEGASGKTAHLTMEETYNLLYFRFEQYGTTQDQRTELIYDMKTGILVKANTTLGDFNLAISLTNYTLDFETEYKYLVNTIEPQGWAIWTDLYGNFKDIFATASDRGYMLVNFTGLYHRDPLLWDPDPFKFAIGRPWLDIKVAYIGDVRTDFTMQMLNISNSECANALLISFPGFLSGFLLPVMNNDTYDIRAEVLNISSYLSEREFTYKETDLTLDMHFISGGLFPQDTHLIYEKITGLLLYVDTIGQNYHLEMTIEDYFADFGNENSPPQLDIPSFPIIITIGISIFTLGIVAYNLKRKKKINLS
jgi:hypothetical protein